jgi:hypothetical protein
MSVSRVFQTTSMPSTTAATTATGVSALKESLTKFYKDDEYHFNVLRTVTGVYESPISLRLIEWFVTEGLREALPDHSLSTEYVDNLRIYTRKMFDPFRRSDRIELRLHGGSVETTVGQMNFFRWFIQSGLWERMRTQHRYISEVLASHTTHRVTRVKREPVETMSVHLQPAFLSFD